MTNAVLITGAAGGIGSALVSAFAAQEWFVIGVDIRKPQDSAAHIFLVADLYEIAVSEAALAAMCKEIKDSCGEKPLKALVNNAALQILGHTDQISLSDFGRSLAVNLTAPFALVRGLLPLLEAASGTVINIGSVHAQATKRGFVSYATSKAALHGMTRALAVDLGSRLRVLCLAPAAVATDMLRAGFENNSAGLAALAASHPLGRIAEPDEVARAAIAMAGDDFLFATGSIFWLDGGVLARLHDPA